MNAVLSTYLEVAGVMGIAVGGLYVFLLILSPMVHPSDMKGFKELMLYFPLFGIAGALLWPVLLVGYPVWAIVRLVRA